MGLLLVLALTALTFGAQYTVKKVDKETDVPKHNPDYVTFYHYAKWNKDGEVELNWEKAELEFRNGIADISKAKVVTKGADEKATAFQIVANDTLTTLRIGK